MTIAVCHQCGKMKWGSFNTCPSCDARPATEDDIAFCVILSDHHFGEADLRAYSEAKALGKKLILPGDLRAKLIREFRKSGTAATLSASGQTIARAADIADEAGESGTPPLMQGKEPPPPLPAFLQGSGQKFIERNRSRQNINHGLNYEVEGSPRPVTLPFVTGVMADLSGQPVGPRPALEHRRFLEIDVDNFDYRMEACRPRVAFPVPNALTGEGLIDVDLTFNSLQDFSPAAVARQVEPLREHLHVRAGLHAQLGWLSSSEAIASVRAAICDLDRNLNQQLDLILHHEDFTALEGTWRGLHYLVTRSKTGEMLKVRVLDITKKELGRTLRKYCGKHYDSSPLFKLIYRDELETPGGQPYGCLVGDYAFDQRTSDVEMLAAIARIAATANCPFIAAAAPSLINGETWQELSQAWDLSKTFSAPEYTAWRRLRESADARFLCLTLPRVLARAPYDRNEIPAVEFQFAEDAADADHRKYCWMNAAYTLAANINRSFSTYGWGANIRGPDRGGQVEGLPEFTFTFPAPRDRLNVRGSHEVYMRGPTEIGIAGGCGVELKILGLCPLQHPAKMPNPYFWNPHSVQKPAVYEDNERTNQARVHTQLHVILVCCHLARYLQCIGRDKFRLAKEGDEIGRWLNDWIKQYCSENPHSDQEKAERPLRHAHVTIATGQELDGPPYYVAKLNILPHFMIDGLTLPVSMNVRLPGATPPWEDRRRFREFYPELALRHQVHRAFAYEFLPLSVRRDPYAFFKAGLEDNPTKFIQHRWMMFEESAGYIGGTSGEPRPFRRVTDLEMSSEMIAGTTARVVQLPEPEAAGQAAFALVLPFAPRATVPWRTDPMTRIFFLQSDFPASTGTVIEVKENGVAERLAKNVELNCAAFSRIVAKFLASSDAPS